VGVFLHPYTFDLIYVLALFLRFSPIFIVLLALAHWKYGFGRLRAFCAFYALLLATATAFHPFRYFSDVDLIVIVGIWGILILVAYESKASPGAALLSLMSVQAVMGEVYSGLGVDRGLPFWFLTLSMAIVFSYGIFHYSRTLRHSVLGRYTEIRRATPEDLARQRILAEQRRRLENGA
jgi:hypothetical protein